MMIVLYIFLEITIPLKIFPLILTDEVNGHFLSMYVPSIAAFGVLNPKPIDLVYLFSTLPALALKALLLF